MKKENFSFSFETTKTAAESFTLLLDPAQWWNGFYGESITGKAEKLNDEFSFYAAGGPHYTKQKLVELIPFQRIAWLVTESDLVFLDKKDEWNGTKICFDIAAKAGKTTITFTHEGLVPAFECYDSCSMGWTTYLQQLQSTLN